MKTIDLTQGQKAIVDDEDYERLNIFKWCAAWEKDAKSYYAMRNVRNGKKRTIKRMARVIMNAPLDKQVDHINHDTLDNRKSNLRLATCQQNHFNMKPQTRTSSIYKGVSFYKSTHKWEAYIKKDGMKHHLGLFKSEKDAALAYDRVALKMFEEYAYTNFPVISVGIKW